MDMNALAALPLVIVVTATAGFQHESIPVAESVIAGLASRTGQFDVRFVRTPEEMPIALSREALEAARVVIFVNTTGELPARDVLLAWIRDGGAFVGVHSASDTWHSSPEYIAMLGGEFLSHPDHEEVSLLVEAPHPATAGLPSPHRLLEEIYSFTNFSRDRVQLLLQVDDGRPISWHKTFGRGRVLYTALGHREDVWTSSWFQQHLGGAIRWALERDPATPRRRAVRR